MTGTRNRGGGDSSAPQTGIMRKVAFVAALFLLFATRATSRSRNTAFLRGDWPE